MLSEHQHLTGCHIDPECLDASVSAVVASFFWQIVNEDTYIAGSGTVLQGARTYWSTIVGRNALKQRTMQDGPSGPPCHAFVLQAHLQLFLKDFKIHLCSWGVEMQVYRDCLLSYVHISMRWIVRNGCDYGEIFNQAFVGWDEHLQGKEALEWLH